MQQRSRFELREDSGGSQLCGPKQGVIELLGLLHWARTVGACSGVTTFIDLRLRFYKDDIQDFHGILIPLSGAHTGENVFLHIRKFLEVVCPAWRSKLIGASADGAANMQGHISGTVTRFAEEATAPGNIVPLTLFSPFSLPLLFSPFSFQRFF